jgi:hypothetical protein
MEVRVNCSSSRERLMIIEIPPACLDAARDNSEISKFGSLETKLRELR